MATRQRLLLQQVHNEIFVDPLSEDNVEDHFWFKKIKVTASSKKYLNITRAQGDNPGMIDWGEVS